MPNVGYATLSVIPSFRGFGPELAGQISKPLNSAGAIAGSSAGTSITQHMGRAIKTGATTVVAAAATGVGVALTKGFGRLRAIDNAQAKLIGLGNSTESVQTIMENATAAVTGTAFGLDAAATAAAGAIAAGVQPGMELQRTLSLVADAATIAGTDMGSMGAIFNKAAASNKVQMDVINQLHDAGVPALSFLAKQMGVTAAEASEMASKGKIDFATFQNAMETGLGGAAQSSGATFSGAMANVGASLGRIGAKLMGGFFPLLAPMLNSIRIAMQPLEAGAGALGEALGARLNPMIERFVGWLERGISPISVAATTLGPLIAAFVALGASGLGPLISRIPLLGGLAPMLTTLGTPLGLVLALFTGLVATSPPLRAALGELLGTVLGLAQTLAPQVAIVADLLAGVFTSGIGIVIDVLTVVIPLLSSAVSWLAENETILYTVVAAYAAFRTTATIVGIVSAAQAAYAAASYGAAGASYAAAGATRAQAIAARIGAGAIALQNSALGLSVAAWWANTQAVLRNGALTNTTKVAIIASSVATGIATAAQWAWNAAMNANPIGIIILAVVALVGALVWFFTQTKLGQQVWENVTAAIGVAVNWLWESVVSPVITWIGEAWQWLYASVIVPVGAFIQGAIANIGAVFTWLWTSVISPVFESIAGIFAWIYNTIITPIIIGIALSIAIFGAVFTWLWESIISPTFALIGAIFTWLWESVISLVVGYVQTAIAAWGLIFTWLWETIISPTFAAIGAIFNWIWTSVILPVVGFIQAAIRTAGAVFSWLWASVVSPTFAAIGAIFNWIYNSVILPVVGFIQAAIRTAGAVFSWLWTSAINPALQAVGTAFNWVYNSVIRPVANFINSAISTVGSTVRSVFGGISSFIGSAFQSVLGVVRGPINGLIGLINSVISGINSVSVTIPDWVPGVGGQTFGVNIPRIPMLASGADIRARRGGTLALLGEGGRDETVTDYGRTNQLISYALAQAKKAGPGGGGGTTVNFNGDVGYDPDEIALRIEQRRRQAAALEGLSSIEEVAVA